jgi:ribose/xylose/arabinose/galactoside ABC-type transport system permease subunit
MEARTNGSLILLSRYPKSLRRRIAFLIVGDLLLLAFVLSFAARNPESSVLREATSIANNAAPVLLAGIGLTGIVYTGAIDLSIGAILAVAGTVFGICYTNGLGPLPSFAACFLTALMLSMFNGGVVRLLKIPAIIVTLAGLTFYRGMALILADSVVEDFGGQFSILNEAYRTPGRDYAGTILVIAVIAALAWELTGRLPRTWLAMGNSETACRLKGLEPGNILTSAFAAGGCFLGLAAVTFVTNLQTIEPSRIARNFELDVIGGVVLGGTNIFGGEGSFLGTLLGGLFLYLVGQTMIYAGVSEYWRIAVQGAVILTVIGIDCLLHKKHKRLGELR